MTISAVIRIARTAAPFRAGIAAVGLMLAGAAHGGVTTDGTLGRAGALTGPDYRITPDLGQQAGGNLFHSFGQFSLHAGESATFSGPNSVNAIIGRVTGGEASRIDGTLRSTIPGASLYLLNPAGLLFGENATLDINGAFHASTADDIRLGDGGRFDARTPGNSRLTVAPVAAFGFLSDAPAPITVHGGLLQVPDGQTISLTGGDLSLYNATLYAPAGRINLAAAGSAGEVIPTDTGLAMSGFGRSGIIAVERTTVERRQIDGVELGDIDAGGGAIFIRGGQFVGRGRSLTQANTHSDRDGRGIDIAVNRLTLTGGSRIQANTFGTGRGGDINLSATEEVTIDGADFDAATERLWSSAIVTDARTDASRAGNINLSTARLALTGGGAISSVALEQSRSGDFNITATESIAIDAINPDFVGNVDITGLSTAAARDAGNIHLSTRHLTLIGGGAINSFTWGDGTVRGGDIDISASESTTITSPQAGIFAANYGSVSGGSSEAGKAGNVTLITGRLSLTGGGIIDATSWGAGIGGNINIIARESVTIAGEGYDAPSDLHFVSGLFAAGYETGGNAGTITLTTPNLLIDDGGGIFASSLLASGGNIIVNADHLKLYNGAEISSSVFGDQFSDGGNVTIHSGNFVALNGGKITAQATQGRGGNLLVNAEVFLHDAAKVNDVLNASSQVTGNDGTVQNNAPAMDPGGSLTVLPTRYRNVADQMDRRCRAGSPDQRSRFIVRGRGSLPPGPEDPATARPTRCGAEPMPVTPVTQIAPSATISAADGGSAHVGND